MNQEKQNCTSIIRNSRLLEIYPMLVLILVLINKLIYFLDPFSLWQSLCSVFERLHVDTQLDVRVGDDLVWYWLNVKG